jgi:hypothetical protein
MSNRIPRKVVQSTFEHFCNVMNYHVATGYHDVGGLFLDYNPNYGGYVISKLLKLGETRPFGDNRQNATDFVAMLHFAVKVHGYTQFQRQQESQKVTA